MSTSHRSRWLSPVHLDPCTTGLMAPSPNARPASTTTGPTGLLGWLPRATRADTTAAAMSAKLAEPDARLWMSSAVVGAPVGSVGKTPDTMRPHPATMTAIGTTRDQPVVVPVEAIASPSTIAPAPSSMNEAVMIGP